MKRLSIALAVIVSLLVGGLFAQKAFAAYGNGPSCSSASAPTPNDVKNFPYSFLCGGDNGYTGDTDLKSTPVPGNPVGGYSDVRQGTQLAESFSFNTTGPPKATGGVQSKVLVWATIDIRTADSSLPNAISPSGNGDVPCPGTAPAPAPGIVYNFNDGSPDSSPAGYDASLGAGLENCGDQGRMVYWSNQVPPVGTESNPATAGPYKFTLPISPTATAGDVFCVRFNISVYYPDDIKLFPRNGATPTTDGQRYTANHVAKQSERQCYKIKTSPPIRPAAGSCVEYTRTGTSGTYLGYTKRTYVSTSGVNPEVVSGLSGADGTGGRTSNFLQHSTTNFFDGRGYLGADQDGKWSYVPSQPDIIIYWGDFYHYTGATTATKINGKWYPVPGTSGAQVHNCFHAACTISAVYGIGTPGSVVQAGQPYVAFITITNDNGSGDALPLFKDYFGAKLGVNSPSAPYGGNPKDTDPAFPDQLNPGDSATMYYYGTAPSSGTPFVWALDAYPDYHAGGASVLLGDVCTANGATAGGGGGGDGGGVKVYAPFSLSVHASLDMTPSEENPTNVAYRTWVTNSSAATVSVPQQSLFFERPGGAGQTNLDSSNTSGPWGPGDTNTLNGNRDPRPVSAGDEYCDQIHLDFTAGLVGPAGPGDIIGQNTEATAGPVCRHVHNKPYVHVLGADASAGGGFGNGCTSAVSGINTYLSATGAQPVGSGAQFGAIAIGGINGFSSTTQRPAGTPPIGSTGLTFGNNSVGGGAPPSPALGGSMGGGNCVPDFFASKPAAQTVDPAAATNTDTSNFTSAVTNEIRYFTPGGGSQLKINNSGVARTLADRTTLTIYVDGDVHIKGNIAYANTSWGAIDKIPSFQLIVKGNIFIDSTVSQLDGLYVAQPNGGTGGNIYTCSSSSGAEYTASNSDLLAQCRRQLVVNGAFVAQKVFLSRSFGSLRNSYPGEHLVNGATQDCTDSGTTGVKDCAAEIFNFSPELYLSQPGTTAQSGPTTGKYDYITSLAPVL